MSNPFIGVVPANAGTHTPRPSEWVCGQTFVQQLKSVVMGPGLRRDDVSRGVYQSATSTSATKRGSRTACPAKVEPSSNQERGAGAPHKV